eukprot:7516221-Prorocentrum_lima.AAC.1
MCIRDSGTEDETRHCMFDGHRCKCTKTKGSTEIAELLLEAAVQDNHVGDMHGGTARAGHD